MDNISSQASEQESMMVHRGDGNDQVDEQECVNVIRCFLGGRINDPVAHGKSNLS